MNFLGKKKNLLFLLLFLVFLAFFLIFGWLLEKKERAVFKEEKSEERISTFLSPFDLAKGKQLYQIITQNPKDPQIKEVEVDPLDVEFGKEQRVRVLVETRADKIEDKDYVMATAITDNKQVSFPLSLKSAKGEEGSLLMIWEGKWKREDSILKNYQLKILVENSKGRNEVTLSFR